MLAEPLESVQLSYRANCRFPPVQVGNHPAIMAHTVLFVYLLVSFFCFQVLSRDNDVWSISNIIIKPKAKQPDQSLTFQFYRRLSVDCSKSKVSTQGCLLPMDENTPSRNRTCVGIIRGGNDWQACSRAEASVQNGNRTRFRTKANSFSQISSTKASLVIEMARKEEIHQ
jgi:hypothetical protein